MELSSLDFGKIEILCIKIIKQHSGGNDRLNLFTFSVIVTSNWVHFKLKVSLDGMLFNFYFFFSRNYFFKITTQLRKQTGHEGTRKKFLSFVPSYVSNFHC